MRCDKCGLEIADKSSFCSHCGEPVSDQGRMQQVAATNEPVAKPPQPVQQRPRVTAEPQPEKVLWEDYPSFRTAVPILIAIVLIALVGYLVLAMIPDAQPAEGARMAGPRVLKIGWSVLSIGVLLLTFLRYLVRLRSTRYRLSSQRIFIERGLFSKRIDEVELEKYKDIFVSQDFWDRIVGCGDIRVVTGDVTNQTVEITDVVDPLGKKEMIRLAARERQSSLGIVRREDL